MNMSIPTLAIDNSIPVVVLDAGYGGLGIARSLGRVGVAVYAIAKAPAPELCSRYWRETFTWDFSRLPADQSVRYLLNIGRKVGRRAILVPTSDITALFVAENADVLRERYIFPRQSPELLRSLANKREMHFLAEKLGIPTAKTTFLRSRGDLPRFLEGGSFPIMLKGIDPCLPLGTLKAIVYAEGDLLDLYDRVADSTPPNLMLQEYIPGGDDAVWMFNGYFDQDSDCLAALTGRKLRQYPAYAGVTSLGICARNEFLENTTRDFMKAIGYRGILDIEYRYDARDGLYKLLDVNPRIGATFRLFVTENGLDVARIFYLDMTGQAVPPVALREGRRWMLEDDIVSCVRYRRNGELTFKRWVSSLRGVQEAAWFAPDDPIPLLMWFWRYLSRSFRFRGNHFPGRGNARREGTGQERGVARGVRT